MVVSFSQVVAGVVDKILGGLKFVVAEIFSSSHLDTKYELQ